MERLTAKVGKSIIVQNGPLPELYTEEDSLYPLVKKLSDYEDAEEQGLLLKLPCKIGDPVFIIFGKDISKQRIKEIKISDIGIEMTTSRRTFNVGSFRENTFLTRKEAEKKLEEMGL